MDFAQLKILIAEYSGLEKDALHIHFALAIYLVAMFAFRQTRRSRFPWLFVLAVELGNEAYDVWHQEAHGEPARWDESLKDLWNTMLWPTVLLFIGRYTTIFAHRTRSADGEGARESGGEGISPARESP